MYMNRRNTAHGRHRRRHLVALLLGGLGLWVFSLTGATDGLWDNLSQLGSQSALAVGLFALPLEGEAYGLLPSSGLLLAGADAVWERLGQPVQIEIEAETSSTEPPIYAQGEDDGETTPNLPVAQAEDVVNYTATGDGNYIWADPVYVANRTSKHLTSDDVSQYLDGDYSLEEGAKILIIHTHGTEAYTPVGTDVYLESDPYRTTDSLQNIVQVGAEMAECFRQAGFQVLHDTNLYDYPDYNSSYTNSRQAVERWLEQYPDIGLILDVHRDALTTQDGTPYRLVDEGGDTAQVMLVVGSDDSSDHPDWEENFTLALQIQQQLTADWGTLVRPLTLRSNSYNQNLATAYLLVEVGGHGNTLQDARNGAQCFAQSVITALKEG